MTKITLQDTVTKTAAFIGAGVDVSGAKDGAGNVADWSLIIEVLKQASGTASHFTVEESNAGFTTYGTDLIVRATADVMGYVPGTNGYKRFTFKKEDFPTAKLGTTGMFLRLNLAEVTGYPSPSITFRSWIEF